MNAPDGTSLWYDTLPPDERAPREPLPGDLDVDVAIVGAGYTGLWTAHSLKHIDPSLRVAVLESVFAGYGASGRNGGWCSALFAGSRPATAKQHGRAAVIAMQHAMFATLDEIERVLMVENIDADWARGGTVQVATIPAHDAHLRAELDEHRSWGFGEDDYRLLEAAESQAIIGCHPNRGALFTPHCAAIHPAKLVRGLARAVERLGVPIYEHTPATAIEPGVVRTERGSLRADVIVRATEAFTAELPGKRRALVPIYSLMIATQPLLDDVWTEIRLNDRPTFSDFRHMIIYGQRTADDRLAFGGRGTPYHFGSRIRSSFDVDRIVQDHLRDTLRSLFPAIGDAAVTHRWGGAVAVPRDWYPSVGYDRASGVAWAGGYVGDGVGTSNIAGRTIADLITDRDTDLVRLPWVGHRSPRWEPEPLRWLGVNAGRRLVESIDRAEAAGKQPRRRARAARRLLG